MQPAASQLLYPVERVVSCSDLSASLPTLFVVAILGVMTGMGSRGEVLVAVRDQRGEWVDCMGRLHHRDFVGLWREVQKYLRVMTLYIRLFHVQVAPPFPAT